MGSQPVSLSVSFAENAYTYIVWNQCTSVSVTITEILFSIAHVGSKCTAVWYIQEATLEVNVW